MSALKGLELYISKRVGRAVMDYKMISQKERIAVGVSGGKDSLALLRILLSRKRFVPIDYEVVALHIDLGYPKSVAVPLERYFKKIKVKYHIEKVDALKGVNKKDINCFGALGIEEEPSLRRLTALNAISLPWGIIRMILRKRLC